MRSLFTGSGQASAGSENPKGSDQSGEAPQGETDVQAQEQQKLKDHGAQMEGIETKNQTMRLAAVKTGMGALAQLAKQHGTSGFIAYQAFAVGEAIISAYLRAAKAGASLPFPFGAIAAAAELARGLALANQIASQSPPAAHGGLDYVPRERTYLLDKGERVLSPRQNRDLTQYLAQPSQKSSEGAVFNIEQLDVHVLENATNAESLLQMDESDLREVLLTRILPSAKAVGGIGELT